MKNLSEGSGNGSSASSLSTPNPDATYGFELEQQPRRMNNPVASTQHTSPNPADVPKELSSSFSDAAPMFSRDHQAEAENLADLSFDNDHAVNANATPAYDSAVPVSPAPMTPTIMPHTMDAPSWLSTQRPQFTSAFDSELVQPQNHNYVESMRNIFNGLGPHWRTNHAITVQPYVSFPSSVFVPGSNPVIPEAQNAVPDSPIDSFSGMSGEEIGPYMDSQSEENHSNPGERRSTQFEEKANEAFYDIARLVEEEKEKLSKRKAEFRRKRQESEKFFVSGHAELREEKQLWISNIAAAKEANVSNNEIFHLNIGGTHKILTTKATLCKVEGSALAEMILYNLPMAGVKKKEGSKTVLIDRNGSIFCLMLSYLRNGKIPLILDKKMEEAFYKELEYWRIPIGKRPKIIELEEFDPRWCANTLRLESNLLVRKDGSKSYSHF